LEITDFLGFEVTDYHGF